MLKVKDGFAKAINSSACGLVTDVLLSNGGNTPLNTGGKLTIVSPSPTLSPDTIQIRNSSNNTTITNITAPDNGKIATYVIVTKDTNINLASTVFYNNDQFMWINGDIPSNDDKNIEIVITGFNYNNEVFYRATYGAYFKYN